MNHSALAVTLVSLAFCTGASAQKPFTVEQILSAPFPSDLTSAKSGNRVAWVFYQQGKRNLWAAEAPGFAARQLTRYNEDDGQELSQLSFSSDGNALVYVRGSGKNAAGQVRVVFLIGNLSNAGQSHCQADQAVRVARKIFSQLVKWLEARNQYVIT